MLTLISEGSVYSNLIRCILLPSAGKEMCSTLKRHSGLLNA